MEVVDAINQNLPELLARDLAISEGVFLAHSMTAGAPLLSLAAELEDQPPRVPQRSPGRAATNMSHHAAPETVLCSQKGTADTARRHACGRTDKDTEPRCLSMQCQEQESMADILKIRTKQEGDREDRRLFINGVDDDWRSSSDTSADAEAGMSSFSVRTRQQSIGTAATSVEGYSVAGGGGRCGSIVGRHMPGKGGQSWVDLDADTLNCEGEGEGEGEGEVKREIPSTASSFGTSSPARPFKQPLFSTELDNQLESELEQPIVVSVPRRRSSLSHQVTTVTLSQTGDSRSDPPGNSIHLPADFAHELASQLLSSPPIISSSSYHHPSHHPHPQQDDFEDIESAASPIVRTGRRQPIHDSCRPVTATSSDRFHPSSPTTTREGCDVWDKNQQSPLKLKSPTKPRSSQFPSKMPLLTQVYSWLESSGPAHHPAYPASPTVVNPPSPVAMASLNSIRVPAEVLENLRISVGNFPDTMLRTSSLTVQMIRNYSHKLRRSGGIHERGLSRDGDELAPKSPPPAVYVNTAIKHKSSFGNLRLGKLSLRRKLGSRFGTASTSPVLTQEDDCWSSFDHHVSNTRSDSPLSSSSEQVSVCVSALRTIFPSGTDYLLDALYAHIIAYNYINSLCGGLPHLQSDDSAGPGHRGLRTRPSMMFAVPPGVTSLADLELQPDDDDDDASMFREFHDDVTSVAPTAAVPRKAASLLGLGATNMGKPVRPRPGTLGGRKAKNRNTTPPAASFSASLESESAMRDLRDAIVSNMQRLAGTVKMCSPAPGQGSPDEGGEDGHIVGANGTKELEPTLLRALCEVVRCYEELN